MSMKNPFIAISQNELCLCNCHQLNSAEDNCLVNKMLQIKQLFLVTRYFFLKRRMNKVFLFEKENDSYLYIESCLVFQSTFQSVHKKEKCQKFYLNKKNYSNDFSAITFLLWMDYCRKHLFYLYVNILYSAEQWIPGNNKQNRC